MTEQNPKIEGVRYHTEFEQGSEDWLWAKKGVISASNVKRLLSVSTSPDWSQYDNLLSNATDIGNALGELGAPKKLSGEKVAEQTARLLAIDPNAQVKTVLNDRWGGMSRHFYDADKDKAYVYKLVADRVTDFLPESFQSFDMARGHHEEVLARKMYSETYEPVTECGFITNEKHGFKLGFSPDGLVGDNGCVEIKSRLSEIQIKAIMEYLIKGQVPPGDLIQVHAGLLATGREFCDYIIYSGGLRMPYLRVYPDPVIHKEIIAACIATEKAVDDVKEKYLEFVKDFPPTKYEPYFVQLN